MMICTSKLSFTLIVNLPLPVVPLCDCFWWVDFIKFTIRRTPLNIEKHLFVQNFYHNFYFLAESIYSHAMYTYVTYSLSQTYLKIVKEIAILYTQDVFLQFVKEAFDLLQLL